MNPLAADFAPRHSLDLPVLVQRTSDLLAAGVPLTLLIDLSDARGPRSVLRYESEGGQADWLPRGASSCGRAAGAAR